MRAMNLQQFHDSGMELVLGAARFVGPRRVEVGTRILEGEQAVIDLGSRPALPTIHGLAGARPWTSDTLLELEAIPARLLILGGGYIAVELAQAMRRLGSRVTLVERGPQLLAREDEDVAAAVAEILREDGVEIELGAAIERVERRADGQVQVTLDGGRELAGDEVLAALGREPATDGIDLDAAGVEVDDRGFVRVDDRLIPYCVFLDPELGRVGVTEREARRRGHDVRIAKLPASAVPRAKTLNAPRGLPSAALRDGVLAHPTMAEGLNQLFASWVD